MSCVWHLAGDSKCLYCLEQALASRCSTTRPGNWKTTARSAQRHNLELTTVEGGMRDLSAFQSESYDLIFHPVSNIFVPEIRPVWNETFHMLKQRGTMLAGIVNPLMYTFDNKLVYD